MTFEQQQQEEKLKQEADRMCRDGNITGDPRTDAGCCGQVGPDYAKGLDEPSRRSLRARAGDRFRRAHREAQTSERLAELIYLLDKHPEVARILDLLELTGA